MKHPFFNNSLRQVAHRGDSVYFPENTLPAFKSAAELGVDCIETDVHLTKDGQCVIWHDDTMGKITGDNELILNKLYEELSALDAGYLFSRDNGRTFPFRGKGVTIATLDEVLKALPDMRFNVDLKDNNIELVNEFARVVRKNNAEKRVLGASFHNRIIKTLRKTIPEIATSFSETEMLKIVILDKIGMLRFHGNFSADAAQVPEYSNKIKIITKSFIQNLHKKGVMVHVWTVNEKSDMLRFYNMRVDAIMTDNPRLLIDTLNEIEKFRK